MSFHLSTGLIFPVPPVILNILLSFFHLFFITTANEAHDIIARPHVARIVNVVEGAGPDEDIACKGEVEAIFECLGKPCIDCFVEIVEKLDESTTCESLAADAEFCPAIEGCIVGCGTTDCTAPAIELETCIETNYPDALPSSSDEELCPGLCDNLEEDGVAVKVPARKFYMDLDRVAFLPSIATEFYLSSTNYLVTITQPQMYRILPRQEMMHMISLSSPTLPGL